MDDIPFDLRSLRILIYNKDDPSWGSELQMAIVKSIGEVLVAPNEAVLPAFLAVKPDRGAVTMHEKELLDIKREMDLMRNEFRAARSGGQFELLSRPVLTPATASKMIRSLVADGRSREEIVRILRMEGVPYSWMREEIARVMGGESKAASATAPTAPTQGSLLDSDLRNNDTMGERVVTKPD
jgi:hypothetical protein